VSLIDRAEQLKTELTDKWVVVSAASPELKRFAALTGRVRTVNMNCRALVEFDNGIDIGWYDIDPGFLTVVDGPRPKAAAEKAEKPAKAAAAAPATAAPAAAGGSAMDKIRAAAGKPAAAPAAAPAAGGSPLDKIRAAGAKPAAAPAPAGGGSPLDKIRAAKKPAAEVEPAVPEPAAANAAVSAPAAPAAPVGPAAAAPLTGSPLDRIRAQGAVKK